MRKVFEEKIFVGMNLHIRPHAIVALPEWWRDRQYTSVAQLLNLKNLADNDHKNSISKKSVSKLRSAINWLASAALDKNVYHKQKNYWFKYKLGFATLTIPYQSEPVTDSFLKNKLLNPFLTYLRKYEGLVNYVWKIEFTEKKMLHVHFTTDSFIHHAALRAAWNRILRANGLLENYYQKFNNISFEKYYNLVDPLRLRKKEDILKAFDAGVNSKWTDPNSTDIHSVRKIKDIAAYICKYMAKSIGDLGIAVGRIWGCNRELSEALKCKLHIPADVCSTEMNTLTQSSCEMKPVGIEDSVTKKFIQFGELYIVKFHHWQNEFSGMLKQKFLNTIADIRGITSNYNISYSV
jgi:hypothetical protein